ncbi:ribosomal protein L5 (mitochondrion) [Hemiselmis andersenii]|uniref:Ribosomal protein L5 n=1 Tax=Hemiselmis andersenii TaxID=464988 RepID=B2MWW0_HEMAN|nr:ribosomal protein L5 [Hemiselmis andersenii]ACC78252.1 ribosomal protein L5 [Hemiselmis andersenii]
MNRIYSWYEHVSKKDYIYKLQYTNVFNIQKLDRIVINIGINSAIHDPKQILLCLTALELITTQKPVIYRSKKSIAAFKVRKNVIIGAKLLLRKQNMYDFLDTFIFLTLPKLNGFRGFKLSRSNCVNFGVFDILIFPQLHDNADNFQKQLGATFTCIGKSKVQNMNLLLNSFQIPQRK